MRIESFVFSGPTFRYGWGDDLTHFSAVLDTLQELPNIVGHNTNHAQIEWPHNPLGCYGFGDMLRQLSVKIRVLAGYESTVGESSVSPLEEG